MVKFKLLGRHWFESSQSHFYKKNLKNGGVNFNAISMYLILKRGGREEEEEEY